MRAWLDGWGFFAITGLCVAVIAAASFIGRGDTRKEALAPAQALEAQRLSDVQYAQGASIAKRENVARPAPGRLLRDYSEQPVYDAALCVWQTHPYLAFAAEKGDSIVAALSGTILAVTNRAGVYTVTLTHADGLESVYTGLESVEGKRGDMIRAGAALGRAAGASVTVSMRKDGAYVNNWEGVR